MSYSRGCAYETQHTVVCSTMIDSPTHTCLPPTTPSGQVDVERSSIIRISTNLGLQVFSRL